MQKQPGSVEKKEDNLDDAAALLLTQLPKPVRELLTETAASTLNIPLWQLVCGLLQYSYDTGGFTSPVLSPDWMNSSTAGAFQQPEAVCKVCHEKFTPRWSKQEFCSNDCGIKHQHNLARLERDRRERQRVYPLGQEPSDRPTSALHKPEEQGAEGG